MVTSSQISPRQDNYPKGKNFHEQIFVIVRTSLAGSKTEFQEIHFRYEQI